MINNASVGPGHSSPRGRRIAVVDPLAVTVTTTLPLPLESRVSIAGETEQTGPPAGETEQLVVRVTPALTEPPARPTGITADSPGAIIVGALGNVKFVTTIVVMDGATLPASAAAPGGISCKLTVTW